MANKVVLYMTQACPFCHMVKDVLDKNKIKYEVFDVGADEAKAQEMIDKSGQMGVPVIDVDGKIIVGFDKPALMGALNIQI